MIRCSKCKSLISEDEKVCPFCGEVIKKSILKGNVFDFFSIAGIIFGAIAFGSSFAALAPMLEILFFIFPLGVSLLSLPLSAACTKFAMHKVKPIIGLTLSIAAIISAILIFVL